MCMGAQWPMRAQVCRYVPSPMSVTCRLHVGMCPRASTSRLRNVPAEVVIVAWVYASHVLMHMPHVKQSKYPVLPVLILIVINGRQSAACTCMHMHALAHATRATRGQWAPPVVTTACRHHRLSPPPPVATTACRHHRLSPPPPVATTACRHHRLCPHRLPGPTL
jgi:hypothetical protein